VRRHADRVQLRHQILADSVVENALALDRRLLRGVERGRVVLEVLNEGAGFGPLVKNLGLAFVNLLPARHIVKCSPQKLGRKMKSRAEIEQAARVHVLDRGHRFIDVFAGNKSGGEFLEKVKARRKILEAFLA